MSDAAGEGLRLFFDLGPTGEETLESFSLEFRKTGGYMAKYNELSGQLEYIEMSLEGRPAAVKLTLKDPVYSVEGPWNFTFPVE